MTQDRIFEPNKDGSATVSFDEDVSDLIRQVADHVRTLLTEGDESGQTRSLFPPAYGDDWARQVEFDRLVRQDLSSSHLAAIDMLLQLLETDHANAEEIEIFMKAMNQIRLVVANRLDITDETQDNDFAPSHPMYDTWQIYQFLGAVQHDALEALIELDPFPEP